MVYTKRSRPFFNGSLLVGALLFLTLVAIPYIIIAQDVADDDSPESSSDESSDSNSGKKRDDSIPKAESAEALLRLVSNKEMVNAIDGGLKELAALQDKDEGWYGVENARVPITALVGLALLASGSLPGSGPYGQNIQRCIDYLLSVQDVNTGFFPCWRIHGHAYATFLLSQVYGHTSDPARIKRSLMRAVALLEASQTKEGGWGYEPDDDTWDEGSTTVCCLQALRGAQAAGINVKNSTIAKAIGYMEKIAIPRSFSTEDGRILDGYTFKYRLSHPYDSMSWALVAASCSSLNNVGVYSKYARWNRRRLGEVLDGGMRWLHYQRDDFFTRFNEGQMALDTHFFHYANFYAAQATWQYSNIEYFKAYFPQVRDILVNGRDALGGKAWNHRSYGIAYGTAMALLVLQIPYQYLPAFQR